MRTHAVLLACVLLAACGAAKAPTAPAAPRGSSLQIKLTTVHVDDQEKALRFYTDVLGFLKYEDETNGDYRWLTVTSPADPKGTALLLALATDPAAKAYQEARFAKAEPAVMFLTDDIQADVERIQARGGQFTMPPTEVMPGSTIATLTDTVGNLIQISEIKKAAR